jgi:hypothetical protein
MSAWVDMLRRVYARDPPLWGISVVYWSLYAYCFDLRVPRPDAIGYFAYAQSILLDGDLSVFDQFYRWGTDPVFVQYTPLGHFNNVFACGVTLLWLPFLLVLRVALAVSGSALGGDGYSSLYIGTAAFASALYGYLGLALSYFVARRYTAAKTAGWATMTTCLLSPFWHYVSLEGSMSHAASAFLGALFLYLLLGSWSHGSRSPARWAVLGYVGGVLSIVRWQDCLLPLYAGCVLLWDTVRSPPLRGRAWSAVASYALACVVGLLPQLLVWQVQYAQPLAVPQGEQFFTPLRPALAATLFLPHHSLFGWTPFVLFAVLGGATLLWRRERRLALLTVSMFVAQAYVNAIVTDPSAGASFGARRFLGLTPFFVLGASVLFARLPRMVSIGLVVVCGTWTGALWLGFVHHLIDPIRYLSYRELIAAAAQVPALTRLQPRIWHVSAGPAALLALALAAVAGCVWVAFRIDRHPVRSQRAGLVRVGALAIAALTTFAVAAARSEPMPIPGVRNGRHLLLNFAWYTNARFDGDAFTSPAHELGGFDLPAYMQWGQVPFLLLPRTRDANFFASSLTTCGLSSQRFQMPVIAQPTRAFHFAVCGLGAAVSGYPALTVRVATEGAAPVEATLHTGHDIWDFFTVPPPQHMVHNAFASVSGYSMPLPDTPTPLQLEISSGSAEPWPCVAIFAITQELAEGAADRFRSVDMRLVANADYTQNAFRAAPLLNLYPDLTPGILQLADRPFLILDRSQVPYDASVLNLRGKHGLRLPLQPVPTAQVSLLVAVRGGDETPRHVADFEVEYEDGSRSQRAIWSHRDAVAYVGKTTPADVAWQGRAGQKLSQVTMDLAARRPKYLWLTDTTAALPEPSSGSVSIFAITQTLPE